jgi:hypothetical protein
MPTGSVLIDHTCTGVDKIPETEILKAREMFRMAYGHTSHGSQVVSGMEALSKAKPLYAFGGSWGSKLFLRDCTPTGDLGNPGRESWAQRTRDLLTSPCRDTNLVMWSWCGQVSRSSEADIETYFRLMGGLEKDFPEVRFVYMTGHLDGTGAEGTLNVRNEQIRAYCRNNGKALFDFDDIESFDPDGKVNYMKLGANDACDYKDGDVTKNWADEWTKKNPGKMPLPAEAAHSRPLNGALKGRAFWWMMARLAGWEPNTTK